MTLHTAFTELFGITHPIALAPMGGTAGGALAAAVSSGGGLGLVGAAAGDREWTERELGIVAERTGESEPWGVGFLSWAASAEIVRRALEFGPDAVMLSFGDPEPLAAPVLDSEALLLIQVTDTDEARQAAELGADVIVAQGTEAGGHGRDGGRGTLSFVPAVVDLVDPIPVLAAGGIADGRGVAAALALGAAGALIGTRFQASLESLADPAIAKAIVEASGEDTERSRLLDIARGSAWPERYPGRSLRNEFLDTWRGREAELAADADARTRFDEAADRVDLSAVPVWASEASGLITSVAGAADLVGQLAADAETALARVLR